MKSNLLGLRAWRHARAVVMTVGAVVAMGCSHNNPNPDEDDAPIDRAPIIVHVKNENFADVNVAVVVSGMARRLGTVSGNTAADFGLSYNSINGQPVYFTATQIGGRGFAQTPNLTVGPGQVVDFKVASVFRQSTASVHDP